MDRVSRIPYYITVLYMRSHESAVNAFEGITVVEIRAHSLKKAQHGVCLTDNEVDVSGEAELCVKENSEVADLRHSREW